MCLAIPGKIVSLHDTAATVDFNGIRRNVNISFLGDAAVVGEYVLVHVGFAIQKVDKRAAEETYKALEDADKEIKEML